MNPKVDFYFTKDQKWIQEIRELRTIVLDCQLTEELKWGCPCYTFDQSNIVLIHVFRDYCALLFFQGALLKDPQGILVQQTANVQSARQIRFTSLQQILDIKPALKAYLFNAVEVKEAGLKVDLKKTKEFNIPEEFQEKLDGNSNLKTAFAALTPGRQRGYLLHFSAPKQAKTRVARIEKAIQDIFDGKGLRD